MPCCMSIVIESKPWCAMTSVENALGIDAQPLTAASPFAQISRNLFARTLGSFRLFHDTPAGFAERTRALAALDRARVARGAVAHATHEALRDRAETEERERDVEVPVLDRSAAGLPAIRLDVLRLRRNAHGAEVEAVDAAERFARAHVVRHARVGEVAE